MVFRVLLLLLIVCLAFFTTRLLLRLFMNAKPRLTCREDGSNLSLHKDPVCGVYLPESDSVVEIHGGKKYYFCSQTCAEKFRNGFEHKTKTMEEA